MSSDLLTVAEVADILRVDRATVARWIKGGVLDAVTLPHVNENRRVFRVRRETVEKTLGQIGGQNERS